MNVTKTLFKFFHCAQSLWIFIVFSVIFHKVHVILFGRAAKKDTAYFTTKLNQKLHVVLQFKHFLYISESIKKYLQMCIYKNKNSSIIFI